MSSWNTIYVLDWYTNKNVALDIHDQEVLKSLNPGDKVVYETTDQTWSNNLTVGTYVWHTLPTDRKWKFHRLLAWEEKKFFEEQQKFSLQIFPLFKKMFKKSFPWSIPVTARFHVFGDQIYFYFYSEERYVFSEFVKELRQTLDKNIFLFQVWARDMVRMSPGTDCIVWCNWIQLCCKSTRPLPSVEIENIILQNLEWRDIEKLKWRCGKLKCCLIYELELYVEESKKFPQKWAQVCAKNNCEQCWFVTSYNIMTNEVTIRSENGWFFRIPVSLVQKAVQKSVQKGK